MTGSAYFQPLSSVKDKRYLITEGEGWLDVFRRAQRDPNCSVKSSLTTHHRITDL